MGRLIGKIIYKTTIILLVLSFLIQTISVFPFYAFANNEKKLAKFELNNIAEVNEENIKLLYEVEEYRDEHVKVFMRSDGKLEYAYYDELVNYYDGNKYQEIDATFKDGESDLSSVVNKYNVKLPKKINKDKKIKLQFNDSSLELIYLDINKSTGKVLDESIEANEIDNLSKIKGQVLYENIFNDVNLKLESTGSHFKENIILNKYISNFSFEYKLKLKKLHLVEEENIINFYNESNELVYSIDPYFMIDAKSNITYDIKVEYELLKKDEYKFKITPSDEFLKYASYPVTIDPIFRYNSSSSTSSFVRTKTIMKNSPTQMSSTIQLTKYINKTDFYTEDIGYYGLIFFDFTQFSDIPYVHSARLTLRGSSASYEDPVVVREINDRYNPNNNINFDDFNGFNGLINYKTYTDTLEFKNIGNNYYTIDLTKYFNVGTVKSKKLFELSPELFSGNEITQFYDSNMSSTYKPFLTIILSGDRGLSPYRTYENISYGDSGDYYIDNLYGYGNYVVTLNDEYNLPFSLCYSSFDRYENFGYGRGFRLSVGEKLELINNGSTTHVSITDGTGYKEYFYYDEEENKYLSEEGDIGYIEYNSTENTYSYKKENTTKIYNLDGLLSEINYKRGQSTHIENVNIYITYNEEKLVETINYDNYYIAFTYEEVNYYTSLKYASLIYREYDLDLEEFTDPIYYYSFVFEYDDFNNLKEIFKYKEDLNTYIESIENKYENSTESEENIANMKEEEIHYWRDTHLVKKLYYEYDDIFQCYLTKALSSKGLFEYEDHHYYYEGIYVEYENNKISKYGIKLLNDNNLKELMTVQYNDNSTVFTDYTGYEITYNFDYFGHTISTYDSEGYAVCYEYENYTGELDITNPNYLYKNKLKHISDPLNVSINPILNSSFEDYSETTEIPHWTESGYDTARIVSNVFIPYGNNVLEVSKSNNSTHEVYQIVTMAPGTYNLSAIARVSDSIYSNNVNYEGYLKVETLWGDCLQSEDCIFNNPEFKLITSSFYVSESMDVKIKIGIRSIDDYTLSGYDRLYIDNIQITNDKINNLYNKIPNHSFETTSNWSCSKSEVVEKPNITSIEELEKMFGLRELKVLYNGVTTQEINFETQSNEKFNIGGFVRYASGHGDLRISVRFYDTTSAATSDYYVLRFASGSKGYTYSSANITIDEGKEVTNSYNRIEIKIENNSAGTAYVDNLHLFNFHCGQSYEYDDKGNVSKVTSPDGETTYEYNEVDSIYKITTKDISYEISNNSNNYPTNTTFFTNEYLITKKMGNINKSFTDTTLTFFSKDEDFEFELEEETDSVISSNEKTDYIGKINIQKDNNSFGSMSGSVYDIKTGLLLTSIDSYGNQTKYEYDKYNRITKIINSLNEYEEFLYNTDDNITGKKIGIINSDNENVVPIEETISYIYDNYGNISIIIINGSNLKTYNFVYDDFNYLTKVYCNNDLMIEYEYLYKNNINTGLVTKETTPKTKVDGITYYEYVKYLYDEESLKVKECRKGILNESLATTEVICYNCLYDSRGKIGYYIDHLENKSYYYNYDVNGRLVKIKIFHENELDIKNENHDYIGFEYNEDDSIKSTEYYFNGKSVITQYSYNEDESDLDKIIINDTIFTNPIEVVESTSKYVERSIKKITDCTTETIINEKLYYDTTDVLPIVKVGIVVTAFPGGNLEGYEGIVEDNEITPISSNITKQEITIGNNTHTFEYSYDSNGNIVYASYDHPILDDKDRTYIYTYTLGQLLKEEVYKYYEDKASSENSILNPTQSNSLNDIIIYTVLYTYDSSANIISIIRPIKKEEYQTLPTNQSFIYNFKNQLTSYTIDGVTKNLTYDEAGNPLSLGDYNLTFESGNLIKLQNSDNLISYEYNSLGIRTKKTVNGVVYEYTTYGDLIISETITNDSEIETIEYLYDSNNTAVGLIYNSNTYYYVRNLKGEIIYIVDQSGTIMGEYKYDAYGNILNLNELQDVALANSIRYKGYYYDVETQLFYCNSRYYSPELCRFISPDSIEYLDPQSINGLNLYCYCFNNPIMYYDPSGHIPEWLSDVGRFIGGLFITAASEALMVTTISSGGLLCLLPGYGTFFQAELSLLMYGEFMMASSWDPLIQSDMEAINWNPFNSNPNMSKVNKVSFYKGEAVIIQDFAGSSFSFGIMGLHKNDKHDIKTVNHEWGHFAQLTLFGPAAFMLLFGIPSMLYNLYCQKTGDWSKYYKMPWEAFADYLGGVKR